MLKQKDFFEKEKNAPILGLEESFNKRNCEFLKEKEEYVFSLASSWASSLFPTSFVFPSTHKKIEGKIDENYSRIFIKDAERTFTVHENREFMVRVLSELYRNFGDYSQSLGYVTSLLLLVLEENQVVRILEHLNFDEKFVPGYWKAEAAFFSRDAFVFQSLLEKYHPQVASHLLKNGILPNTYAQKWFSGLCIHVLPFDFLFEFLDAFLKEGYPYLFKFGLALVEVFQESILGTTNVEKLFQFLRLDYSNKDIPLSVGRKILDIASSSKYSDLGDVSAKRIDIFENKIKPQMEAARKRLEEKDSDDEIVFSDEEEEEEKFSDEDEEKNGDVEGVKGDLKKLSLKD